VRFQFVSLLCALLVIGGCSKHFSNQPLPNQPPRTYVTLYPDSTMRSTTSQQHLHWWGVDPDGFVKGFYISFDSISWTYTTNNDSIFGLKLNSVDTTYTFFVAAVDNENAVDPHPASLRDPIKNSPPTIAFVMQSDVPDTTYPVATFQWIGSDIDGNETITKYFYALDDTSRPANWKFITGDNTMITLESSDGLTEGNHVFYIKATDIAGAFSNTIRMPIDTTKNWYVKKPKGDFLIVDDYGINDATASFYSQMFDTVMGGRLKAKDVWDIKTGYSGTKRGKYVPALVIPTITKTLSLFKYIFWYSDNNPQLDIAQVALSEFKKAGGKVLLTAGFSEGLTSQGGMGDFAPINNIEPAYFSTILMAKDTLVAVDPAYPNLIRDNTFSFYTFPRGMQPKVNARILYRMQQSPRWASADTVPIIMGVLGVSDIDQKPNIVMMSVLLHRFVGPENNVPQFLRKVFQDEFGVQ
jgi:hypothetical protein